MPQNHTYDDCPQVLRDFLYYMLTIKGRSAKTVQAYYIDLRTFLRYLKMTRVSLPVSTPEDFSAISIEDVTTEQICSVSLSDVYAFLNYTMDQRANGAKTRSRKVSSIRMFYRYISSKTTLLSENPVKDLEVPSIRKSMPVYLTLEESVELLSDVAQMPAKAKSRDYCILTLFLNCGMRLSELVGINLQDIRGNTLKLLGKGDKERIVYLNEACMAALEAYQKERATPKEYDRNALFLSQSGKRLTGRRVEQIVAQALAQAGLDGKGYSPHKLRHTAATLMYQHGQVDIRVLKEILGHANLGTTEIYTHVSDRQIERAANLSPLARIKPSKINEKE